MECGSCVQVVPFLPPKISGVGDYSLELARCFLGTHGIPVSFIEAGTAEYGQRELRSFHVRSIPKGCAASLTEALHEKVAEEGAVILHLVGYGYQDRGCPFWLLRAFEAWRKKNKKARFVVMFHELGAHGPIWTSAFWLGPLQRYIVQRFARLCHTCITSMAKYRDWLLPRSGKTAIKVLPIFSTIGEPSKVRPLWERSRRLVIFGGGSWTRQARDRHAPAINAICQRFHCTEILAIGKATGCDWPGSISFRETGNIDNAEISAILGDSLLGFIDYYQGYLAKSSIFGAYCAHGVTPLMPDSNSSMGDQIGEEIYLTFARASDTSMREAGLQGIADQAQNWYKDHSIEQSGLAYQEIMGKSAFLEEPC